MDEKRYVKSVEIPMVTVELQFTEKFWNHLIEDKEISEENFIGRATEAGEFLEMTMEGMNSLIKTYEKVLGINRESSVTKQPTEEKMKHMYG